MMLSRIWRIIDATLFDLGRQLHWSYLPPLLVYLAAGVSGLTSIVGTFFIKEYLGLSAAFLAGLAFWAGIPWAMKMPCSDCSTSVRYASSARLRSVISC